MKRPWCIDELRRRAARLPRLPLATLPTPLDDLTRLSAEAGSNVRVLMKRDDQTGLGLGGNKIRKLEFSFGEARQRGCDVVVHGLAAQSNYCRLTAAAAAKAGLRCVLALRPGQKDDDPPQANRLLDHVFGAEVRMLPPVPQDRVKAEQQRAKAAIVAELEAQGRTPYLIGEHDEVLGAVAYALCVAEIVEQLDALGTRADYLCVAGGVGTQAGLVLGTRLLGVDTKVLGFWPAPDADEPRIRERCAHFATQAAALLGADESFTADEIANTSGYSGPGYGVPNDGCLDALLLLGRTEGLVVGPTYTAKSLAATLDCIRTGQIEAGRTIVFMHTGGTPELFAYNVEVMQHLEQAGSSAAST
ncbi:MAG: pyridoxal-phosphate dependent enzyme [Phycisphaeraceae bacterium]